MSAHALIILLNFLALGDVPDFILSTSAHIHENIHKNSLEDCSITLPPPPHFMDHRLSGRTNCHVLGSGLESATI